MSNCNIATHDVAMFTKAYLKSPFRPFDQNVRVAKVDRTAENDLLYYIYRKRGSASYIVREVRSVRQREREGERERERERETEVTSTFSR